MSKIKSIYPRQILNSKGQPTVEVTVFLADGNYGTASCPAGTSKGKYEAIEIRDNNENKFQGLGVENAVLNIKNVITPALIEMEAGNQREIDKKMIDLDGTPNKAKLGANAILSVSMAVAKAAAKSSGLPLYKYLREYIQNDTTPLKIPTPAFNVLNGGLHSASSTIDFQEFLVIPATSKSYEECLEIGTNIYWALKKTLLNNNLSTLVADEGGFSPKLATNQDALLALKQAIDSTNIRLGFDVFLGMDTASSSFYSEQKYHIKDKSIALSSSDLIDFYESLNKDYHFLYLEDGLSEDDWDGWTQMCARLSQQTVIIGDDLTVTNPFKLQNAITKKAITGILIKPNQIGSVIETLAVVEMARQAGLKIIVSHRSGEANDDFIADFAVAVSADYVKFGAPQRGERIAKYNRLLQIDQQLRGS